MMNYPLEDIRGFYVKRLWLVDAAEEHGWLYMLSPAEYEQLRARKLVLHGDRAAMIRAFIEGWVAARR